jgi:O-antigen ligase
MWILRGLLVALALYVPYQQYFVGDAGAARGLNTVNLLFGATLAAMVLTGTRSAAPAPARFAFVLMIAALVWAYLIGQAYDNSHWVVDLTILKNAVLFMLLYFIYYHAARDPLTLRIAFAAILFIAALAALQAIRQALDYGIGSFSETHRAAGPFAPDYSGANRAAVFYCMFLPVFVALALYYRGSVAVRLAAAGGAVLLFVATLFTYSRQAYFILAVLVLLMALRRSVLLALIAAIALISYESWLPEPVLERIAMTEQVDAHGEAKLDESTESRFVLWQGALELIKDRPWGIGLNQFKSQIGRVTDYEKMDAHNHFVLIATEAGLPGLLAMVVLIAAMLWLGWSLARTGTDDGRVLGTGFLFSAVAMALGNVYGSRFFDGDVMGNFWALAGLTAALYRAQEEAEEQSTEDETAESPEEGVEDAAFRGKPSM